MINVEQTRVKDEGNDKDFITEMELERLNTELESRHRLFEHFDAVKQGNLALDTLTFDQLISDLCRMGRAARVTDHRSNTTEGHFTVVGKDFVKYTTLDGVESILPKATVVAVSPILKGSSTDSQRTPGLLRPKLSMVAFLDSAVRRGSTLKVEFRFQNTAVQGRFLGTGADLIVVSPHNPKEPIFIATPQVGSIKLMVLE